MGARTCLEQHAKEVQLNVAEYLRKLSDLGPVPECVEGLERKFLADFQESGHLPKLTEYTDMLEKQVKTAKRFAEALEVGTESILPSIASVMETCKTNLTHIASATIIRILMSKAAKNLAAGLQGSIDSINKFMKEQDTQVPDFLKNQLSQLDRNLKAARVTASKEALPNNSKKAKAK